MTQKLRSPRARGLAAMLVLSMLAAGWAVRESVAGEKNGKGWLGVSVEELTPSLRKKMKLGTQTGLLVTNVVEESPADDAGFHENDVILEFDGQKVDEAEAFTRLVRDAGADKKVTIVIMREGERKNMEVMLGKRRTGGEPFAFAFGNAPHAFAFGNTPHAFAFAAERPRLGVQVHEVDENLAAYFKVQPGEGVLVLEVNEDTPAEKAGLKSGDVITKLGDEKIRDAEDLIEALADYEGGEKVTVAYVRQGKSASAEVELEEERSRVRSWAPRHNGMGMNGFRWNDGDDDPHVIIRKIAPNVQGIDDIIQYEVESNVQREIDANLRRVLEHVSPRRTWML